MVFVPTEKEQPMIRKFIKWLKYHLSYEWCYDRMEDAGVAVFGCCCGQAGGSRQTNRLSEMCMDCPHLTLTDGERRNNDG